MRRVNQFEGGTQDLGNLGGLIRPLKGLIRPLKGLIRPLNVALLGFQLDSQGSQDPWVSNWIPKEGPSLGIQLVDSNKKKQRAL